MSRLGRRVDSSHNSVINRDHLSKIIEPQINGRDACLIQKLAHRRLCETDAEVCALA